MIQAKSFRFELATTGVATITLDRPEKLNSLTFEVYEELTRTFGAMNDEAAIRAVVITGEGRGFCSGGDVADIIGELFARDMSALLAFTRVTGALIRNIRALRRPVIAAVNGTAVGAGAVIAIACDLRVASDKAKFGFIFPKVGLCGADMGAAYLLPRIVGLGRANELLFFGDVIDAERAERIGLVNKLTLPEECVQTARKWAERLASGPAFAHSMTKQMMESEHTMSLDQAIEAEAQAQAVCMAHPDFRASFDAWKEKRSVTFAGASMPFSATAETEARAPKP
jgi:enoyl-CoA hydratase/carnithine racemase